MVEFKSNDVLLCQRYIKGNIRGYPYQGCSLCKIKGSYYSIENPRVIKNWLKDLQNFTNFLTASTENAKIRSIHYLFRKSIPLLTNSNKE